MPPDPTSTALTARVEAAISHFEAVLVMHNRLAEERDRRYEERYLAQKEALSVAYSSLEDCLDRMNQIKPQLAADEERIAGLEHRADLAGGKEVGVGAARTILFASVAAAASIVAIVLTIVHMVVG